MDLFKLKALVRVLVDGNIFKKQDTANEYANAINDAIQQIEFLERKIEEYEKEVNKKWQILDKNF